MNLITTYHGRNYIRFEQETHGVLYEAWVFENGRPNRYAIDCQPVSLLPSHANAVTAAAIRAMPILQAH